MDIRKIDDTVSVSGQIFPDELQELADLGFKTVICNRPDGEAMDQPSYEDVAAAAKTAGLETEYIPVVPGLAGQAEVEALRTALGEKDGPILLYCRSGARSGALYDAAKT